MNSLKRPKLELGLVVGRSGVSIRSKVGSHPDYSQYLPNEVR